MQTAPGLFTIEQDGQQVPALAQVGKSGFMFILNRETGEPVPGVVAAPALGLLYYARNGEGAWKQVADGEPERLRSTLADLLKPLRIVESRSHPSPALDATSRRHLGAWMWNAG